MNLSYLVSSIFSGRETRDITVIQFRTAMVKMSMGWKGDRSHIDVLLCELLPYTIQVLKLKTVVNVLKFCIP